MSMFKGMAADISGKADVCHIVRQFSKCQAVEYLLPTETILFSMQSQKEEFTFTNEALLRLEGENATTTRKMITRTTYRDCTINHVRFETAGRVDRDVEIKFEIGKEYISIDIAKAEIGEAQIYYKVLEALSRSQRKNARMWDISQAALKHGSDSLRLMDGSLMKLADESLEWLEVAFERTHPRCYREVIQAAFLELRTVEKTAGAKHP